VTQIGGWSSRTFDWQTAVLEPEAVTLSGTLWRDGDPGCCPSAPFTATFRVENGSIVEAK